MQLSHHRQSFLGSLPNGADGTYETLRMMRTLVHQYKSDTHVRGVALDVVSGLRPKDWVGEVRALFEYVRDRIRYVRDIAGIETLQTPPVTIDLEAGDCDDKSTLLATLLATIGYQSRFVAVGYEAPGAYQHVYVEAKVDDRWFPLDATVMRPFGWAPRSPVSRMVLSV